MRVIDPEGGVIELPASEATGFIRHLAVHRIQVRERPRLGAVWTADSSSLGSPAQTVEFQLEHREETEKVKSLYQAWRAANVGAMTKAYYAEMTALGHPATNDAGLIKVVDAPGSNKQIGVATNTGKEKSGRLIYFI